jgi:mRNA (guanine-N7-)-methyltransferase
MPPTLITSDAEAIRAFRAEHGEIIEHGMIIEFRYDKSLEEEDYAKWVPVRVRWDKMKTRMPNKFTTAASNWYTIQHPISMDILSNPPQTKYYSKSERDKTNRGLSEFHNGLKSHLLSSVIKKKDIVLDYAVGKGGDLQKWKDASFVLGVDIFDDNIQNKQNGACQRYLKTYNPRTYSTRCLFLQGDSSKNIKSGEASTNNYDKAIVRSVFGLDPKNPKLGKGVVDHYEKGKQGFDVTSIQFAVHYMFSDITHLTGFLKNVAECTALNGYFVGTCYDGATVFQRLNQSSHGQLEFIKNDGGLVCRIKRNYPSKTYETNESCLGYKISVLQESIGTEIEEYLVFFDYFIALMTSYGFALIESEMFETYYGKIKTTTKMTEAEQHLSFLNRTFKFQKIKEMPLLPIKLDYVTV